MVSEARKYQKIRRWAPRLWMGLNFSGWVKLLWKNHFQINFSCIYIAVIDTITSSLNSLLWALKQITFYQKISKVEINQPPLFIIGHWRTGTTLLHELLVVDPQHTAPNNYQCYAPNHFLLTEKIFTKLLYFLTPARRPMDNMQAGWDRPQEDEFALCNLGVPSPYWTIAFPNRPLQNEDYYDLENVNPKKREIWRKKWIRFLKEVTYRNPGRLIIKSPPHTWRIKMILEIFPKAKFVHIVRDPYVVFPSTLHLWKTLYRAHGLQKPKFNGLEEFIYETFLSMYRKLEETKPLIPSVQYYQIRYEDLINNPIAEMRSLYRGLDLNDFERTRPLIENYFRKIEKYETNRYDLNPESIHDITHRWGEIIQNLGYSLQRSTAKNYLENSK